MAVVLSACHMLNIETFAQAMIATVPQRKLKRYQHFGRMFEFRKSENAFFLTTCAHFLNFNSALGKRKHQKFPNA